MMMHPNWGALVTAGEPVHFWGYSFYISKLYGISYSDPDRDFSNRMSKVFEQSDSKISRTGFVPMLTFLIMGTLAFSLFGPIGSILGGYLATFFTFLSVHASWVPAVLIGAFTNHGDVWFAQWDCSFRGNANGRTWV